MAPKRKQREELFKEDKEVEEKPVRPLAKRARKEAAEVKPVDHPSINKVSISTDGCGERH